MRIAKMNLWALTVAAILLSGGAVRADLDKSSKDRKEEKAAKPEMGGDEHERYHQQLAEEGEKTLEEINKLLDEIQNDLGGKQTGEPTQSRQKQVVERLEKLIKELSKSCSSCSSASSSCDSGKKQQASQKQKQSQKQKAGEEKDEKSEEQKKRENQKLQAQQQKRDQQKSEAQEKDGKVENDRKDEGPVPDAKSGSLADRINEARRWGVLPMKIAEAMLFSTGKEAPPEYREVISRYYKKLTEVQSQGK